MREARIRIGKVVFKGAPNVAVHPSAGLNNKDNSESGFIQALVRILARARRDEIAYYAMCVGVYDPNTQVVTSVTLADVDKGDRTSVLGSLRILEADLVAVIGGGAEDFVIKPDDGA